MGYRVNKYASPTALSLILVETTCSIFSALKIRQKAISLQNNFIQQVYNIETKTELQNNNYQHYSLITSAAAQTTCQINTENKSSHIPSSLK